MRATCSMETEEDWENETVGWSSVKSAVEHDSWQERKKSFGQFGGSYRTNHPYSDCMYVDSRHVGRVIGRGGKKINEIRRQTNTTINVARRDRSTYESRTRIDVMGWDEESVQKAVSLIKETCEDGDENSWQRPQTNHTPLEWSQRNDDEDREFYGFNEKKVCGPLLSAPTASTTKGFIDWDSALKESKDAAEAHWSSLAPIQKAFYVESEKVAALSEEQVETIRGERKITVKDHSCESFDKIPKPITSFKEAFFVYPEIMDVVSCFSVPTPIQCQAWPILLSGRDLIGIAQTGTGKTLAFLLPALIHIDQQPTPREQRSGPTCLILSPTRELAKQIEEEVKKFSFRGIRSCCIYGGANRRTQIDIVQQGVEIVIATPGRLNDLYMNKIISLDSVSFLVLDEADRMLDMGFEAEIKKVLLDIRPDRHTVMTSATWPQQVRRLANNYMNTPIQVNVGSLDLATCHNVQQSIEFVTQEEKFDCIVDFLNNKITSSDKVIIFVGRKITADYLSSEFAMRDVMPGAVQCIHGDREQDDREEAIKDFKTGVARVLIATDVASRGLDITDVTCVVNYDFPRHMEEYVHRIGRTGRAGKSGQSLSFVTRADWSHAQQLIDLLNEANQTVPNNLIAMAERYAQDKRKKELEIENFGGTNRTGGYRQRGSACYKCGNVGHFSRECPN